MTRYLVLAVVGVAAASLAGQAPAPAASREGTIRGRVVTADGTARPIANARVSRGGAVFEPVLTDVAGRFELANLPPGTYTLAVDKAGYAHTRYGARNDIEPPLPVRVDAGQVVEGIEIPLPQGAAISGRVVDDLGDPVVALEVTARMVQRFGNELRIVPTTRLAGETDDNGEFRLGGLAPGRYTVAAAGATEGFVVLGGPTDWRRPASFGQTFFPNAPNVAQAQPVSVAAGQERTGIDFTMLPARSATVTFVITDDTGAAVPQPVSIIPIPGGNLRQGRGVRLVNLPTGVAPAPIVFEPGEWNIRAQSAGRVSITRLTVADGDEVQHEIVFGSGGRITGRIVFDGMTTPPPFDRVRLDVGPPEGGSADIVRRTGAASTRADGGFEIAGIAGRVIVRLAAEVSGWRLESAMHNGRDLTELPIEFTHSETLTDVRVVLSDAIAGLTGTTADTEGRPAPGCLVVFFPDAREVAVSHRRMRLVRSDRQGRFQIDEVPSGAYRVAATNDLDAATWMTAEYLERLRLVSQAVTLSARDRPTAGLVCVPAP